MDETSGVDFLEDYCSAGAEAVLQKGYHWFHHTLTPTLQQVSKAHPDETVLLGEAWLIAGEVHELLYAPNQAIICYQLAIHFNLFSTDSYRWLALVEEQLGNYLEATKNIELALKYTTDGEVLMEDRQRIQDCIVYDKGPDFIEGSLLWTYSEALAEGNFEAIIKSIQVSETTDIDLLKCLYRAYGGIQDKTNGAAIWQQILTIEPGIVLEELDLFYWK